MKNKIKYLMLTLVCVTSLSCKSMLQVSSSNSEEVTSLIAERDALKAKIDSFQVKNDSLKSIISAQEEQMAQMRQEIEACQQYQVYFERDNYFNNQLPQIFSDTISTAAQSVLTAQEKNWYGIDSQVRELKQKMSTIDEIIKETKVNKYNLKKTDLDQSVRVNIKESMKAAGKIIDIIQKSERYKTRYSKDQKSYVNELIDHFSEIQMDYDL